MTDTVFVGDSVECEIRQPFRHVIRMKLETGAAASYANKLLADKRSVWRKCTTGDDAPESTTDCGASGR